MIRTALFAVLVGMAACSPMFNVKFVEPNIAHFKAKGNRVVVPDSSLVSDVLVIELLKSGKFVIAGHELPNDEATGKAASLNRQPSSRAAYRSNELGAGPEAAPNAAPTEPAKAEPAPTNPAPSTEPEAAPAAHPAAKTGSYDYIFSVYTKTPQPKSNDYPVTYSFSVTAASGEIIYIKALSGGDLKLELASTIAEVAGLLL